MKIHYELTGIGWAEGYLLADNGEFRFSVSYMRDALGELTDAILYLIENFGKNVIVHDDETGEKSSQKDNQKSFVWEGEPWGYKWHLTLQDDLNIEIAFSTFEDVHNEGTILKDKSTIERLAFEDFVKTIVYMLDSLIKRYGFVNYKSFWHSHEFPVGNYLRLKEFVTENGISKMVAEPVEVDEAYMEALIDQFSNKNNLAEEIEVLKHTAHSS